MTDDTDQQERDFKIREQWLGEYKARPNLSHFNALREHSRVDGKDGRPQRLAFDLALTRRFKQSPLAQLLPEAKPHISLLVDDANNTLMEIIWGRVSADDELILKAFVERLQQSDVAPLNKAIEYSQRQDGFSRFGLRAKNIAELKTMANSLFAAPLTVLAETSKIPKKDYEIRPVDMGMAVSR